MHCVCLLYAEKESMQAYTLTEAELTSTVRWITSINIRNVHLTGEALRYSPVLPRIALDALPLERYQVNLRGVGESLDRWQLDQYDLVHLDELMHVNTENSRSFVARFISNGNTSIGITDKPEHLAYATAFIFCRKTNPKSGLQTFPTYPYSISVIQ